MPSRRPTSTAQKLATEMARTVEKQKARIAELEAERDKLNDENVAMQETIEQREEEVTNLEESNVLLEAEIKTLKTQNQSLLSGRIL